LGVPFDPGIASEPFVTLCRNYPGAEVYPLADFRTEWGPVFYRGRLDGSARVLAIGQDPATNESIARRILVGAAGQRVQGLLAKLGMITSYVMVNTFLYGVYTQAGGERHKNDAGIRAYRERWFDAVFGDQIEIVIALGGLADEAWTAYAARKGGRAQTVPYAHVVHPTWPESSSRRNGTKLADATQKLLEGWNAALDKLRPAILHPDVAIPSSHYGSRWQPGDLVEIPADDLPPGLPAWMRSPVPWAARTGDTPAKKRATLVITVPPKVLGITETRPPREAPDRADDGARVAEARAAPELEDSEVAALAAAAHPESGPDARRALALALRRYGLRGRVVTMNAADEVLADGIVWVSGGTIAAVQAAAAPRPPGFEDIEPVNVRGTLYPGFMDLHNHLAYNVASLWNVPGKYGNRDQWKDHPTYDQLVKRPLSILGKRTEMLPAICRYVEAKSLFGGVTTTQGIRLAKGPAISGYFSGFVRNVETPDDASLPRGESHIPDVATKDVAEFWKTLERFDARGAAYLLHVSEGRDPSARHHFTDLQLPGNGWAIGRALVGIHCAALKPADFAVLGENGGSMVWSPMSNLLLYGETADVAAAKAAGLRIALGCDWSPSGSKNLLQEMKVAWLYSQEKGDLFSPRELVAMVTRVAASIVRWDAKLGSIEAGKIADLTVLARAGGDPYEDALRSTEKDVRLVVVGGVPRYGHPDVMRKLVTPGKDVETICVGGQVRTLDLETTDPRVPTIRFTEAEAILRDAMGDLPRLEAKEETHLTRLLSATRSPPEPELVLALDEIEETGMTMRVELGAAAGGDGEVRAAAKPKLPTIGINLDPPTIADHAGYWDAVAAEGNLPAYLKGGLPALYGSALPRRPPKRHTRAAAAHKPKRRAKKGRKTARGEALAARTARRLGAGGDHHAT